MVEPKASVVLLGDAGRVLMPRLLFVCGKNRWRSPTAEHIFSQDRGVECASAGVGRDAETPLSAELIEWADLILVMERGHKTKLAARFRSHLAGRRVVCLNIPDQYTFMDPALVSLLEAKVAPYLPQRQQR